jgi:toxin ParE1/3/4
MYKIKFTILAENDLNNSYDYIKNELKNQSAAENLVLEVESKISKIAATPYACTLVSDIYLKNIGIRFLPIKNYLVFYKVEEELKEIIIIRFLYGKREWRDMLK